MTVGIGSDYTYQLVCEQHQKAGVFVEVSRDKLPKPNATMRVYYTQCKALVGLIDKTDFVLYSTGYYI